MRVDYITIKYILFGKVFNGKISFLGSILMAINVKNLVTKNIINFLLGKGFDS